MNTPVNTTEDWQYRVQVAVQQGGGAWTTVGLAASTPADFRSRVHLGLTFSDVGQAIILGRLGGAARSRFLSGGAVYQAAQTPLDSFAADFPDVYRALVPGLLTASDQRPVDRVWLRVWCSRWSDEAQALAREEQVEHANG